MTSAICSAITASRLVPVVAPATTTQVMQATGPPPSAPQASVPQASTAQAPAPQVPAPQAPASMPTPVTLALRPEALNFKKPTKEEMEANESRKINVWPCPRTSGIVPESFVAYVKRMTKAPGSAGIALQGVEYFFSTFELPSSPPPILTLYKELVAQGLITQAMGLELWDASIPWTCKMISGMTLFADWLGIHAEDLSDEKGMQVANSLAKRHLLPLKKQLPSAKDDRLARRKKIDRQRRYKLPSVQEQGEAVNWSLIDLEIMLDAYAKEQEETGTIPASARRVINACFLGTYSYRSYPGRPGEVNDFKVDIFLEFVADQGAWYVVIEDHKTAKTHGPMGRMIPPQLKDLLPKILKYSCKDRNLLLPPARGTTKATAVNKALVDWAAVYTPGYQHPEPTLYRKAVETEIAHKDNVQKAAEMNKLIPDNVVQASAASVKAARMAGHHKSTANQHYILENGNPELDAMISRAYIHIFKGPLPPLTPEQQEAKRSRTAQDILRDFATKATRKQDGASTNVENEDLAGEEAEEEADEEAAEDTATIPGTPVPTGDSDMATTPGTPVPTGDADIAPGSQGIESLPWHSQDEEQWEKDVAWAEAAMDSSTPKGEGAVAWVEAEPATPQKRPSSTACEAESAQKEIPAKKAKISMAYRRKVPAKLEGNQAIESFIYDHVKPHLDNPFMIHSKELARNILKAGKEDGVNVFEETHTEAGIRSYILRHYEEMKQKVAAMTASSSRDGQHRPA